MQCNIDKTSIRKGMKEKRKSLTREEIMSKSRAICTAFAMLEEFLTANTVCVYMSAFNEVETEQIISLCQSLGKTVAVPVVDGEDIYLSELTDELDRGAFGIREPVDKKTIPAETVDIFAVPALAFDKSGARVGFGKGYYDKLLKNASAVKAGLCYGFQLAEKIPVENHDILMDYIITENETVFCERNS